MLRLQVLILYEEFTISIDRSCDLFN